MTQFDPLIDLLLTVGHVDGTFDQREKEFVRTYLAHLTAHVGAAEGHFDEVYERLEKELGGLAAEVMSAGDENYVQNRLKVRAVSLFRSFAASDQAVALELVNGLVAADGTVNEHERQLHEELLAYFVAPAAESSVSITIEQDLVVEAPQPLPLTGTSLPLLDPLERPFSADSSTDYDLVFQAITAWERQRARGNGLLTGVTDVMQLPPGTRLLDDYVHVLRPDTLTEVVVLGDLHGCYACLKAALLQSDFVARVERWQADPRNNPNIVLVMLGDYLDRGRFGFDGVLRAALKLLATYPNHVVLLRGNHEFFVRHEGRIVSAVTPAEALPAIQDLASQDMLEAYRHLFDRMPTSFLFDRTLFVHGGIPRDRTLAERYRDLSSLNDRPLRFEMMWSDPVDTDAVPHDLQAGSTRFTFGREQFRMFMERVGCQAMVRGHEQIEAGFAKRYDVAGRQLYTLFSAGGAANDDLPSWSRYRGVTPMALTLRRDRHELRGVPWAIDWQSFCDGACNGFYR